MQLLINVPEILSTDGEVLTVFPLYVMLGRRTFDDALGNVTSIPFLIIKLIYLLLFLFFICIFIIRILMTTTLVITTSLGYVYWEIQRPKESFFCRRLRSLLRMRNLGYLISCLFPVVPTKCDLCSFWRVTSLICGLIFVSSFRSWR